MRRTTQLDRIIGKAESLQQLYPAALNRLAEVYTAIDGYPVGTDNPKVTASSELTTVESAAGHRCDISGYSDELPGDAEELKDLLRTAEHALDLLRQKCWRLAGTRVTADDKRRVRCIGTSDAEGAVCWNVADNARSDGRCIECGRYADSTARRKRLFAAARKDTPA